MVHKYPLKPATEVDKKRGLHKFTLQVVNKSLIQTYGQRCLTLNLSFRWAFTHIFVIADVENAILWTDFLNKGFLMDINRRCLTDLVTNVKLSGSMHKGFSLSSSVANVGEIPIFCKLLKTFANIIKSSFHKETLLHSITHHITTTSPSVHNQLRRLAPEKLSIAKAEFTQMLELGIIHPSKSNWASLLHLVPKSGGGTWHICGDSRVLNSAI